MRRLQSAVASCWTWIANAVDWICQQYLKNVDPKHAVASYLVFNSGVFVLALFLTATWADFYTTCGYWVTLTGFLVAIIELYRTRTMATEIRSAVAKEVAKQRSLHYRYCLERAKTLLADARTHVLGKSWPLAVIRLHDLNTYFSYLKSISPSAIDAWAGYMESVGSWVVQFGSARNKTFSYNANAWEELGVAILTQLDEELKVFQPGGGFYDDPQ